MFILLSVGARSRAYGPPSLLSAAIGGTTHPSLAEEKDTDRIGQPVKAAPFQGAPPSAAYGLDSLPARRCPESVGSEGMSGFRLSKGMDGDANDTQPRVLLAGVVGAVAPGTAHRSIFPYQLVASVGGRVAVSIVLAALAV